MLELFFLSIVKIVKLELNNNFIVNFFFFFFFLYVYDNGL